MKSYDIAIIGAGPGGLYAHYYANLKGFKSCIIEANDACGGQPLMLFPQKEIHDFPCFEKVTGHEIIDILSSQISNKENIFLKTAATHIEKENDSLIIQTKNGETFSSKFIIIATGGGFFNYNKINGVENPTTHYSVKDINVYKDKKVVIAGGGDSAIDWALELLKKGITKDVSIVHRRNEFRANGQKIEELKSFNPTFYLNKSAVVLDGNRLGLTDNQTSKVDVLRYDYLIVQYGLSFSLQDNTLLKNFKLSTANSIIVDYWGRTNIDNIYAIGNAAFHDNKPKLISIAVTDAIKAIDDIAKKVHKYE